jgi:hypothetical protein
MPELDGQYPFQICGRLCQTRKTPTLAWAAKISWLGLLSKHVPFRVVAAVAPTFTTIHNTRRKCGAKFKILNFCRRKSGFLRSNFRSEMLLDNFMTLMTSYILPSLDISDYLALHEMLCTQNSLVGCISLHTASYSLAQLKCKIMLRHHCPRLHRPKTSTNLLFFPLCAHVLQTNNKMAVKMWFVIMFVIPTIMALLDKKCSQEEKEVMNFGQICQWSNSLFTLKTQDQSRIDQLIMAGPEENNSDKLSVKNTYYKNIAQPLQTICHVLKRVAGRWNKMCGFLDGEKLLCMDGIYTAVKSGNCLVYSFGLADDWDFEVLMAKLGKSIFFQGIKKAIQKYLKK